MKKPRLEVNVFIDYICPFCYIGSERLLRLKDDYDLKVAWWLVEIHPQTPPEGMPLEQLGYPAEQWRRMMQSLYEMAATDGLPLAERQFTTNSHKALLLSEAAKGQDPDTSYALHQRLFTAFFAERLNIGDPAILQKIAVDCGLPANFAEQAWQDPENEQKLIRYQQIADKYRIQGVPTYIFGHRVVYGASAFDELKAAAANAAAEYI